MSLTDLPSSQILNSVSFSSLNFVVGDDGTIYDNGTGYKIDRGINSSSKKPSKNISHLVNLKDDSEEEGKNFSFKDNQRLSQSNKVLTTPENRRNHHFKKIHIKSNNEASGEGDQSSEGNVPGEERVQEIRLATYPQNQDVVYSSPNKSSRVGNMKSKYFIILIM
jgi:hypothetical protein